jgi:hypothetical protein
VDGRIFGAHNAAQITSDSFGDFRADIFCDGQLIRRNLCAREIDGREMVCGGRPVSEKQVQPLLFSTPVSTVITSGKTTFLGCRLKHKHPCLTDFARRGSVKEEFGEARYNRSRFQSRQTVQRPCLGGQRCTTQIKIGGSCKLKKERAKKALGSLTK